ncbi:MAG: phosphatase PAP2 family protein [Pseudomonadota bacterium]
MRNDPKEDAPSRSQTPPLFWWIVGSCVVLALLPTAWTPLDLRAAALFLGPDAHNTVFRWWWVELINLYVPAVLRVLVLVALGGWLWASFTSTRKHWRLPLAFVVLAGALGPGLVVNSVFKDNWQRARPYQVQEFGGTQQFTRAAAITDQCNNNCSFVSGHVACGFFLVSLMLVDRRRRVLWGVSGLAAGFTIGFARMADGAHWLSDVLWASPITLLTSWVVWKLLLRIPAR